MVGGKLSDYVTSIVPDGDICTLWYSKFSFSTVYTDLNSEIFERMNLSGRLSYNNIRKVYIFLKFYNEILGEFNKLCCVHLYQTSLLLITIVYV